MNKSCYYLIYLFFCGNFFSLAFLNFLRCFLEKYLLLPTLCDINIKLKPFSMDIHLTPEKVCTVAIPPESIPVFLKLFYPIAPFLLSTRRFRPPSLIKQTQGSNFEEFYLKKVSNS